MNTLEEGIVDGAGIANIVAQYFMASNTFPCPDNEEVQCDLLDICVGPDDQSFSPLNEAACFIECVSEEFQVDVTAPLAR